MCGIIGYSGRQKSMHILLDCLKKLEYRGYDSSGIALKIKNEILVKKTKGMVNKLVSSCENIDVKSNCGIGHTRWATHGVPSDINSHPHSSENISLVHNGIIENYMEIKNFLIDNNVSFISETDTEVIVRLLEFHYKNDPIEAIRKTLKMIKGTYALGIIFKTDDQKIYSISKESPLIIGLSEDGNFICSDIAAILSYTKKYQILKDGDIAIVSQDNVQILSCQNKEVEREILIADWDDTQSKKGDFEHFMIKEIFDQPESITKTLNSLTKDYLPNFDFSNIENKDFKEIKKIYIVGCGTAMHSGLIGKAIIESMAKVSVNVEIASEFRYSNPNLDKSDLVIAISQSGETADTLAALKLAKENNIKTLAIVNVKGSTMARMADNVIYTEAGIEISVASTKAYSVQLISIYILAFQIALTNNQKTEEEIKLLIKKLYDIVNPIKELLNKKGDIENIAKILLNTKSLFYIGRGLDYPLAKEASLKLKELSYIHSEAYPSGELKHGAISLIEEKTPVIAIATQDNLYKKSIGNILEVKSRGATIILICKESNSDESVGDYLITIPDVDDIFTPFLSIIPVQLISYYTSKLKGLDVDKPRNLAKSVTVE